MRVRGMRDIPTAYGLSKKSKPNSRDEAITELARLEHEKVRLEREMTLWQQNLARTDQHLQRVLRRLNLLQTIVEDHPPQALVPPIVAAAQTEGEQQPEQWTAIKLEY